MLNGMFIDIGAIAISAIARTVIEERRMPLDADLLNNIGPSLRADLQAHPLFAQQPLESHPYDELQ